MASARCTQGAQSVRLESTSTMCAAVSPPPPPPPPPRAWAAGVLAATHSRFTKASTRYTTRPAGRGHATHTRVHMTGLDVT